MPVVLLRNFYYDHAGGLLIPFFEREPWRLTVPIPSPEPNIINRTNLSNQAMIEHALVRHGYGTIAEIRQMDTRDFLDAVEYQEIASAIEQYHINEAQRAR